MVRKPYPQYFHAAAFRRYTSIPCFAITPALERLTDEKADTTGSLRKEVTAFLKTFASSYISSYSVRTRIAIIEVFIP